MSPRPFHRTVSVPMPSALEAFLSLVESRTTDATHLRLLKAARKTNAAAALEKELAKVMEELLRED